jgi:hypothetical protein
VVDNAGLGRAVLYRAAAGLPPGLPLFDVSGGSEDSQIIADGSRDTSSFDGPVDTGTLDRGKKPVHDQNLPPDQKPKLDQKPNDQKLPPDQKQQPLDGGGLPGQCSDENKWGCKGKMDTCTYSCPSGGMTTLYTIKCSSALGGSCTCENQNGQPLPCSYTPLSNMYLCEMCYYAFDNGCCVK